MKVLVTGGAGFIGRHCVKSLRKAGHSVRVVARSSRIRADRDLEVVCGDVTDPGSLAPALEGIDAVVHCVGIIVEPRGVTFESVVRDGALNLVTACAASGVERIVYISALGARPHARSRYHGTKWEAEESIRGSGITHTILRPSIVFGPGDAFINKLLKLPFIILPAGGGSKLQPIFVEDLSELIAQSLANPAAENQTFDSGGPEQMTYREMMTTALEVSGRRKPMISVPMGFMKLLASISDPFQKIYPPLALITREQYKMLQEDNIGDNTKLLTAFPGVKLHALREGLAAYLRR